jgi:hypothetical protein
MIMGSQLILEDHPWQEWLVGSSQGDRLQTQHLTSNDESTHNAQESSPAGGGGLCTFHGF